MPRTARNYCRCGLWWPLDGPCERCAIPARRLRSPREATIDRWLSLGVWLLIAWTVIWFGAGAIRGWLA